MIIKFRLLVFVILRISYQFIFSTTTFVLQGSLGVAFFMNFLTFEMLFSPLKYIVNIGFPAFTVAALPSGFPKLLVIPVCTLSPLLEPE